MVIIHSKIHLKLISLQKLNLLKIKKSLSLREMNPLGALESENSSFKEPTLTAGHRILIELIVNQ